MSQLTIRTHHSIVKNNKQFTTNINLKTIPHVVEIGTLESITMPRLFCGKILSTNVTFNDIKLYTSTESISGNYKIEETNNPLIDFIFTPPIENIGKTIVEIYCEYAPESVHIPQPMTFGIVINDNIIAQVY